MAPKLRTVAEMEAECDRFNKRFAVGEPVKCWTGPGEGAPVERKVRFPAQILSGHTTVVYIEGGGGCVALTHVQW